MAGMGGYPFKKVPEPARTTVAAGENRN